MDESLLDFKLDSGYEKFSKRAADFLQKQGFSSRYNSMRGGEGRPFLAVEHQLTKVD
jgi:hypothetical protein